MALNPLHNNNDDNIDDHFSSTTLSMCLNRALRYLNPSNKSWIERASQQAGYLTIAALQTWCSWIAWCFADNITNLPKALTWANRYPFKHASFFQFGSFLVNMAMNIYYAIVAIDVFLEQYAKAKDIYQGKKNWIDAIELGSEIFLTLAFATLGACMFKGGIDDTASSDAKNPHPELLPVGLDFIDYGFYLLGLGLLHIKIANDIAKVSNRYLGKITYNIYLFLLKLGINEWNSVNEKLINETNTALWSDFYDRTKRSNYYQLAADFRKEKKTDSSSEPDEGSTLLIEDQEITPIYQAAIEQIATKSPITREIITIYLNANNTVNAENTPVLPWLTWYGDNRTIPFSWKALEEFTGFLSAVSCVGYLYQVEKYSHTTWWLFSLVVLLNTAFGIKNGKGIAVDLYQMAHENDYDKPFYSHYTQKYNVLLGSLFLGGFFACGSTLYGIQEYFANASFFVANIIGLALLGIIGTMLFNGIAFQPLINTIKKNLSHHTAITTKYCKLSTQDKHGMMQVVVDTIYASLARLDPKETKHGLETLGYSVNGALAAEDINKAIAYLGLPSSEQAVSNTFSCLAQILSHLLVQAALLNFKKQFTYTFLGTVLFYLLPAIIDVFLVRAPLTNKQTYTQTLYSKTLWSQALLSALTGFIFDKILLIYTFDVIKNRTMLFSPFHEKTGFGIVPYPIARACGAITQSVDSFFANTKSENQDIQISITQSITNSA